MRRPISTFRTVFAIIPLCASLVASCVPMTPTVAPAATAPAPAATDTRAAPAATAPSTQAVPAAQGSAAWCSPYHYHFVLFPGGDPGGTFTVNVYNGARQAQADLGPKVDYVFSSWDPERMIQLPEAVLQA